MTFEDEPQPVGAVQPKKGQRVGDFLYELVTSAGEQIKWLVEVKTSGTFRRRELAQLKVLAAAAERSGSNLVYFFLFKPDQKVIGKIEEAKGRVRWFMP